MKHPAVFAAALSLVFTGLVHADEPTYPLTTCVVSGEALDSMGKPFVTTHEGEEVKLCCKMCKREFDRNPEEFTAKVKAAKAAKATEAAADE